MMPGTASPQITVEIRGADRCGKTVVGQLVRAALRGLQVTVIGPGEPARRYSAEVLRRAAEDLKARGLTVEIAETETAGPIHPKHQIDARRGMNLPPQRARA